MAALARIKDADVATIERYHLLPPPQLSSGMGARIMNSDRLIAPWWALRVGLGAAAFLAGLDKYFNILADWTAYVSPVAAHVLPFSASTLMHIVGVIEMAVGLAILGGLTQLGGYVAGA